MFLCELVCKVVHKNFVEVIAAEMCITVCCKNFEYAVAEFEDGYIECTAAEVVYQNLVGAFFFIETVCKGCCRRFVDDSLYIKTCDSAGILGCLFLSIREVSRNCDNRFCYFFSQIAFCIVL